MAMARDDAKSGCGKQNTSCCEALPGNGQDGEQRAAKNREWRMANSEW
jgi:hypothetical protein